MHSIVLASNGYDRAVCVDLVICEPRGDVSIVIIVEHN